MPLYTGQPTYEHWTQLYKYIQFKVWISEKFFFLWTHIISVDSTFLTNIETLVPAKITAIYIEMKLHINYRSEQGEWMANQALWNEPLQYWTTRNEFLISLKNIQALKLLKQTALSCYKDSVLKNASIQSNLDIRCAVGSKETDKADT